MPCRFLDPELQRRYDRDGYVVLRLLSPEDRRRLAAVHDALERTSNAPFAATLVGRSRSDNEEIAQHIDDVVRPRLAAVLGGWRAIGSTFLVKDPAPDGALELHQDWWSVDERTEASMNAWCPLADVGVDGGALEVLPGSHRWFASHRSPTIDSVHVPFGPEVDHAIEVLPVPAGHAVLYDHRLLHGSKPNGVATRRVVAQVGLAPVDVPLVMCFAVPGGRVELREVGPEAFFVGLDAEAAAATGGRVIATVPAVRTTTSDVLARLGVPGPARAVDP